MMTKPAMWLTLAGYLIFAIFLGGIVKPPPYGGSAAAGHVIGSGLAILFMGGIIPLIIWAFTRFERTKAKPILITWFLMMLLAAFLMWSGQGSNAGGLTERTVAELKGGFMRSCPRTFSRWIASQGSSTTAQRTRRYCECLADYYFSDLTREEYDTIMRNFEKERRYTLPQRKLEGKAAQNRLCFNTHVKE